AAPIARCGAERHRVWRLSRGTRTMRIEHAALDGVLVLTPHRYEDDRGSIFEAWSSARYRDAGSTQTLVQDHISHSTHAVLRGLHRQTAPHAQGKLVTVPRGVVYDVVVDMRPASPTFGTWAGTALSADNGRQLWIPPGFAHGFQVVSEDAIV